MPHIDEITERFKDLNGLSADYFIFNRTIHPSFAAAVANADLKYNPGIYLVYSSENDIPEKPLYIGKAGANKSGEINSHQLPKRLLAVCYPPKRYSNIINKSHPSRNYAWPLMMEHDGIKSIIIFCFYSNINNQFTVEEASNPLILERGIRGQLESIPQWAKK